MHAGDFSEENVGLNLGWLNSSGGYHYTGILDEVAIHRVALSPQEIAGHYYLVRSYNATCTTPVKIMPVGDSITQGSASGADTENPERDDPLYWTSYRKDLWDSLLAAGANVDFVGSQQHGSGAGVFDYDHEGHGGFSAYDVAYGDPSRPGEHSISQWLSDQDPDVVLLHIGTNDLTESAQDVASILDLIKAYSEDVTVVLARIINRECSTPPCADYLTTSAFNANLATMAQARIDAGDKIILVDQETGAQPPMVYTLQPEGDMWDHLHPYKTGYAKMAGVWLSALQSFIPSCQPIAPTITSQPVTKVFENQPYRYTVKASGYPAPEFFLDDAPTGMTINQATGSISWSPTQTGSYQVEVRAHNEAGEDWQEFTLTVEADPNCPSGIIGYWKLEESSGTTFEDFYNGHDGSCIGQCPDSTLGQIGNGQQFNGVTAGINVPADEAFDWAAGGSFTIEYWMNRSGVLTRNEVIVGRDAPEAGNQLHWWTGLSADGHAMFVLIDRNGNGMNQEDYLTGTSVVADGQWHHIAVVRDGATGQNRLYVDGELQAAKSVTYTAGFDSPTAAVNIGWLSLGSGYRFGGLLDDVAIYGRALGTAEVQEHYGVGLTGVGYCHAGVAPVIIQHPASVTTAAGQPASFSVNAVSRLPMTYVWKKGGNPIIGAPNSNTYSIGSVSAADAGSYTCTVSNTAGNTTSNAAVLTVNIPPSITTHPSSTTVNQGEPVSFTVAATGTAPLHYEWKKDGSAIPGAADAATYSIGSVAGTDAGSYSCRVYNMAGEATSSAAVLTVNIPPSITTHPSSTTVNQGEPVSFTVAATGTAPLHYEWKKDGSAIPGAADAATYSIGSVAGTDAGSYSCRVYNMAGEATSSAAELTVNVPPSITAHPASVTANPGDSVSFTVVAKGTAPLHYEWKKDGSAIPGAPDAAVYMINSVVLGDGGSYSCRVYNMAGEATSDPATLTVGGIPPTITTHPQSQTLKEGDPLVLTVAATGTAPLHYQWKKDGQAIQGANGSSYFVPITKTAHSGSYTCTVSNVSGIDATSNAAVVTVMPSGIEIITHPKSATVLEGNSARFLIRVRGPRGARLTYQWQRNGVDIPGATRVTYSTPPLKQAEDNNAEYRCKVTNATTGGWVVTDAARVTVEPIIISLQPRNATVRQNATARFSVRALGPKGASLQYQWLQWDGSDWVPVAGATRNIFTLTRVPLSLNGTQYRCEIRASNGAGPIYSDVVTLTVNP